MGERGHLWAIVLAGGDGSRLRHLTHDGEGIQVPKQFCAFDGRDTMVRWTVDRAARLVPRSRIVAVVAEQHRRWWRRELSDLGLRNLIVQPANRGTAAGVLLPLLEILRRDRLARVLILPSDHHVADEVRLSEAVRRAIDGTERDPSRVVLLGMTPCDEDTEYGWIVPAGARRPVQAVAAFVEKPDRKRARALLRRGALLNSLILVGTGSALLHLFALSVPRLLGEFVSRRNRLTQWASRVELYDSLPSRDFSQEVLQRCSGSLSVVRVGECGWSDLGTPARLRAFRQDRLGAVKTA